MFGTVCPATGEKEATIATFVNEDIMKNQLKQVSDKTRSDRYAVVIMDGAGWHVNDIASELVTYR